MSDTSKFTARPHVVLEANLKQLQALAPNVAVLPWGATEAHNYHLPHGTDVIEATQLAEQAVERANALGARCAVLPTIPFGIDHQQLSQVVTITMRASTQLAVLRDVAESLHKQGIDRLVLLNFHGANQFVPLIRDIMFEVPIFIVLVNGFQLAPESKKILQESGDHADEFETSLLLHLTPELVAPLATAGDGAQRRSELPALSGTAGIWFSRNWAALTKDTGTGNPAYSTAAKGKTIFEAQINALAPALVELSKATEGQFPFIIEKP